MHAGIKITVYINCATRQAQPSGDEKKNDEPWNIEDGNRVSEHEPLTLVSNEHGQYAFDLVMCYVETHEKTATKPLVLLQ